MWWTVTEAAWWSAAARTEGDHPRVRSVGVVGVRAIGAAWARASGVKSRTITVTLAATPR